MPSLKHTTAAQVDLLPEISMVPTMYPPADQLLPQPVQADVDTFLQTRQPGTVLTSLKGRLLLREGDPGLQVSRYNVGLVNALVCYLGAQVGAGACMCCASTHDQQHLRGCRHLVGECAACAMRATPVQHTTMFTRLFLIFS